MQPSRPVTDLKRKYYTFIINHGIDTFVLVCFPFLPSFPLCLIFCMCRMLPNNFMQLLKQSYDGPWLHREYCEECWLLFEVKTTQHLSNMSEMFPTWQYAATIFTRYSWHKLVRTFLIFFLCWFTSRHHSNGLFSFCLMKMFACWYHNFLLRYLIEFVH